MKSACGLSPTSLPVMSCITEESCRKSTSRKPKTDPRGLDPATSEEFEASVPLIPTTLTRTASIMLSDSAILKKIERQPKRTAGFKQLVRELGVHGDERRELSERLERLVASGQLVQVDSDRYAIPQAAAGQEHGGRAVEHASRRLRLCHSRCQFARCTAEGPPGRRYFHSAAGRGLGHARRPGAGGDRRYSSRRSRRRAHRAPGGPRASDRGRNLSLRQPRATTSRRSIRRFRRRS